MAGRRIVLMLLAALLVSGVGLGGWSTPVPGLAQDTRDAADVVVYQEPPGDVADVSVFYEPLAPYGTWISLPEYGLVWIPHDIAPGWRPYTTGRWVYTNYGWTWVSDQEWGWAPFHYGRWAFVASYGWVWIPGTAWAPAWVVWRHAPGWVGWAPLPPQVVVRPGIEIRAANIDVHIEPSWFCFVEERRILAPRVSTYIAPPAHNVSLVHITQNVTYYTVIQNRVVNRGVPVERIERVMARPVPRMRIVETQAPEAMHRAKVREREREVVLFRPATPPVAEKTGARAQAPQSTPPPQLAPGTTLPQQREDTYHRLRERQLRERAALEERQRQAPQSGLQSLSPEQLRVQRGAERRALEDKARRDRQEQAQQQVQQQLQQRQEQERQRTLQQQQQALERQRALQQQQPQALERQRAILQQQQQQQVLEHQRALQQQPRVQQPQAPERQRAFQQQHNPQPSPPQGMPPQASQQPRAATQRAPEEGKEQRKKQQQPPQALQPSQQ
jgi:Family of unknown function (DUF6600)